MPPKAVKGKASKAKAKKEETFLKETKTPKSKLAQGGITVEKEQTEVERKFYELITEDVKRKILRLRAHLLNLDVVNETLEKEIRVLKEEKTDAAGELTTKVDDIYKNILKVRNENEELTKVYNEEKRRSEETIGDIQQKYKAMHDQLSSEIKRLNGKLNATEEFRLNRDNWINKFSDRVDELAEKEQEAKNLFVQMEAKSVYERGLLKDELLEKLTFAGEEFTGAGSTSSSDLNLRLIRENIALQKNIDMLVNSNNEMEERMQEELKLYKANKAGIPELEKRNRALIEESQLKLNNIKRLTDEVQKLKHEYIAGLSYREQNVTIKEFQICARFRRKKLINLVNRAGQKLNAMEREVDLYEFLTEQYKNERKKVEEHLENLRLTVERSVGLTNVPEFQLSEESSTENTSLVAHSHGNLLNKLVWLLESDFDSLDLGVQPSLATLKPYEKLTHFDELFRKDAPSLSSLMDLCVAHVDSDAAELESRRSTLLTMTKRMLDQFITKEYETKLPATRTYKINIFDVESGTSLYYSSEPDDPELMEKKDENAIEDDEDGSSSSSEAPQRPSGETSPPPPPAPSAKKAETPASTAATTAAPPSEQLSELSKMPPGTIVDVMPQEEDNEDLEPYDYEADETYVGEEEEYDTLLFY